jgi:malto-oligosyltrehalose trehalohydrolase
MSQTTRACHAMPFGAQVLPGGGVRFRLWAPSVPTVILQIEGAQSGDYFMTALADGWHQIDLSSLGPGARYRYRLPGTAHGNLLVPDPASRFNPDDVHSPSEVIDPTAFTWTDTTWRGRPWTEAVIYELHVGTFSPAGNFAGVTQRLDHLVESGVTAIELMPVADFPGQRGWGYDGVLPFAPDASYGRPEDMKALVDAAHARGLMVFLDVVYNHFGPEGNYLYAYCPEFFNTAHHTPWGAAINFDGPTNRTVRDFFVHNALYWLEEFHLDGLRLDAVHAIHDDNSPDIVEEIHTAITAGPGRERHVHLILENDWNEARYLETRRWQDGEDNGVAQWNDDIHHALHVILTGETDGYYADYADDPLVPLARCLAEGFAWQGETSAFRGGARRGARSDHLPPAAFVNFLQTHDQVGNRALGERLCVLAAPEALTAATALLLLAPQPPMLFMGEEFAAATPFLYFCDFSANPDLARAVTEGRRREFAEFAQFADPATRAQIPDPNATETFAASRLDWSSRTAPPHAQCLALYRALLALRAREIAPRLPGMIGGARVSRPALHTLRIEWTLGEGSRLELLANLGSTPALAIPPSAGRCLYETAARTNDTLPPWWVAWHLTEAHS